MPADAACLSSPVAPFVRSLQRAAGSPQGTAALPGPLPELRHPGRGQAPSPAGQSARGEGGRALRYREPSCLRGPRPPVPAWARKGRGRPRPTEAGASGLTGRESYPEQTAPEGARRGRVSKGQAVGTLSTPHHPPSSPGGAASAPRRGPSRRARPTKGRAVPGLRQAQTPGGCGGEGDSAPAGPPPCC